MNGFYYALDIIKDQLELDNDVNVVNTGIIEDVLLKKKDIYPYSHILVNNATLNGSTWTVSYSVICMDIVDISKEQTTDIFRGQNNVQDVLNTQFVVINRVLEVLRRGENTHLYQLDGSPNCEPFEDRFEHGVAGWTVTFDLLIPNDMTVCATDVTPVKLCPDFEYTITDADSNVLYTGDILSGDSLVQVISSATVTNSLTTVLATILAQGTVELADVNNIDSDGSTVPTPAGVAFTCTPQAVCSDATAVLKDTALTVISTTPIASGASADITAPDATYTVQYEDTTPIASGSIVSGGSVLVEVPVCPAGGSVGAKLLKTGVLTSYISNDDGAIQSGRDISFLVLPSNNPFGNTKRFTDKTDSGTFANSVAYDWSTYDGTTVLAYYFGDMVTTRNLTTQLGQYTASTIDGLANSWYLWNANQMLNVLDWSKYRNFMLNYPPFSTSLRSFWISTINHPTQGIYTDFAGAGVFAVTVYSSAIGGVWCRECTVTGTTIS